MGQSKQHCFAAYRHTILSYLTYRIQHACLPCKINPATLYGKCRHAHALLTSRYGTANLPYLSTSNCLLGLPLTVVCCTKGISRATSFSLTTCTHIVTDPVTSGMHIWAPKPSVVRVYIHCCHGNCRAHVRIPDVAVTRPMFGVETTCSLHTAAWHA